MTLTTENTNLPSLFAHTTRKDWGIGVLAWETGGKRGYLFEDGEERTMANGFHNLMRKVEQPSPDQKAASVRLQRLLMARANAQSTSPGANGLNFSHQLMSFRDSYPAGLLDPKWVLDIRGEGAEQRSPRHRSSLILSAQEQLSVSVLDALIANQQYEELYDLIVSVLSHTDLVPSAQLKKSKTANRDRQRDLANSARELLYGTQPYAQRFDRYVAALAAYSGEPTRWEMATALSAVVHPSEHICIHPMNFRLQLKAAGSRETIATRPNCAAYTRLLAVARVIAKKLGDQNELPRDLLDIHDFIRATLKPAPKAPARPSNKATARSRANEEDVNDEPTLG
jgi:hypothetical protein